MKKLLLFGLGVIASMSVLTSCKKDTGIEIPTVEFLNNVSTYTATEADTAYTFIADVKAFNKIDNIKVMDVSVDNKETQVLSITKFDSDTRHSVRYTVSNLKDLTSAKKLKVVVTDKNTNIASATFTVNPYVKPGAAINTYSATLLGSLYNTTEGSFYATTNGLVYNVNTAATNSSLIDLIYYFSGDGVTGNGATIGGADDTNINGAYKGIANWATKNATRFATTSMSTSDFDAITDDTKINELTTFSDTKEIGLTVGKVFAFKTAAGKKGLVKVTNITKGYNTNTKLDDYQFGTIEIVVKVQK
jgi:hypothetical protein